MSNLSNVHTCGLTEIILFLLAIVFGTGCSICSKTMMSLRGTNGTINVETGECFHLSDLSLFGDARTDVHLFLFRTNITQLD